MQNMGGGRDAAAIVPIIVVTVPSLLSRLISQSLPCLCWCPCPHCCCYCNTVPLTVIAVPLLFCLLPSLSLLLPMSTLQAVMVAVGSGGADTSSFHPCPCFQQQQGMLGNAAHHPIVVSLTVIEDCGWTWTCTSGRGGFVRQKYWCEIDNINNCILLLYQIYYLI